MQLGKVLKKIVNLGLNLLICVFFIVLIISIYNSVQIKVLKNSYASFFGYSIFEVQTGSMEPAIQTGDWVIVKYAKDIHLDDVVTFKKGDDFITHRVVEAYKETFVTQGDANNSKDEAILKSAIVGKVVKILPNFGAIRKIFMNPVVLLAMIVTLYLITSIFKDKKKDKKIKNVNAVINVGFLSKLKQLFKKEKKEKEEKTEVVKEESVSQQIVLNEESKSEEVKKEDVVLEEALETSKMDEEDLEKTMYFRMLVVDDEEKVDKAYKDLKEKEKKLEEKEEQQKKIKEKIKKEKAKEEKEKGKEESLELISSRKKRFKNIIEKGMFYKEALVKEMVDLLEPEEKNTKNSSTIKNILIKTYIDARYYNFCGDVNVEYNKKNMYTRLNIALQEKAQDMIWEYKGPDKKYASKVENYTSVLALLMRLEDLYYVEEGIQSKRDAYKTIILKYRKDKVFEGPILKTLVQDIIDVQKKYDDLIKYMLEKLDTNMFSLESSPVNKNITAVYLKHNIQFSKVYSDYIVDKTYSEGIVAEDKMAVLFSLLSKEVLKNILAGDFNKKYLFYVPDEMYQKSNKLSSLFLKFDDEYAKVCMLILLPYETFKKNKTVVKGLIKEGYKFAVDLSDVSEIKPSLVSSLELMNVLFVDKRTKEKKEMVASLPEHLQERVVFDDVKEKLDGYGE